ncbi:MAG: O-antigen ligase family protein, partial [Clostridia bacterium]|nr:O-antigen ligase family protein [Clostridia bacterium]
MFSFIYRNIFGAVHSPTALIRPIIPAIIGICIFFKSNKKVKIYTIIGGCIYLLYGIVHLYLFKGIITKSSYGTLSHEAQYIMNYTFMIFNLFIYTYIFKNEENTEKLRKSLLFANAIYIISIFIAIITNTSSSTYIEKIGYKGWFEQGNTIGAILILSLFVIIKYIDDKEKRKLAISIILMEGIYLTFLLGTRTGLLGFIFVVICYVLSEITINILKKGKINKKTIIGGTAVVAIILLFIITFGSTTFQRRKHLKDIEDNIYDNTQNQKSHITGSLLEIKEKIDNGTLEEGYMTEAQQKTIIELYNICNKLNISNNDQRSQQLIYNTLQVKNQKNIMYILFGNGYVSNFRELVLEMEIPAFLFNFGIIGFILYFIPFFAIFIYGIYIGIKNIKNIDRNYLMTLIGSGFVFVLSFLAGYTFFNSSSMIIIVVVNTLLLNEIKKVNIKRKDIL